MLVLNNFLMYYSYIEWLQTKWEIDMRDLVTFIIKLFIVYYLFITFLNFIVFYAEQCDEANKRHQEGEKQLIVDLENYIN